MNSKTPLVTCIIPTRDRPGLVCRAIKSALSQSYENMEIIVIDDSDNRDTQEVLARSDFNIKYIKNEENRGASYSRNIGLLEAKGDIISFLDDDDIWLPRKTEYQIKLIDQHPVVTCNSIQMIAGKKRYVKLPSLVTYESLLYNNYLGSCSFVSVAAYAIKDCFFDESLKRGQDWDMWISIMKKNSIREAKNADEYLVEYNAGMHPRISNSVELLSTNMSIYQKYISEHNDFTTKMFCLYNMTPFGYIFRLYMESRLKKEGFLFFIKILIKRFFGRFEIS